MSLALTCPVQTLLSCIDNSGASVVECVNVLKKKRAATIGQYLEGDSQWIATKNKEVLTVSLLQVTG